MRRDSSAPELSTAYRRELEHTRILDAETQTALARRYLATRDPAAAKALVTSNLRLVISVAGEYRSSRIPFADLVQEGNVGLLRAVEKFDPTRGVRFSSYAALWIRAHCLRYLLDNWSLLRFGTTATDRRLFFNLRKQQRILEADGIAAEPETLAQRLDAKPQDVERVRALLSTTDASIESTVSVNDRGRRKTIGDTLPAPEAVRPDVQVERAELDARMKASLQSVERTLAPRERALLRERWLSETPRTLEDVGRRFGISRERTRQIETRLLLRLRAILAPHLVAVPG